MCFNSLYNLQVPEEMMTMTTGPRPKNRIVGCQWYCDRGSFETRMHNFHADGASLSSQDEANSHPGFLKLASTEQEGERWR